jgi:hypothetical protein
MKYRRSATQSSSCRISWSTPKKYIAAMLAGTAIASMTDGSRRQVRAVKMNASITGTNHK